MRSQVKASANLPKDRLIYTMCRVLVETEKRAQECASCEAARGNSEPKKSKNTPGKSRDSTSVPGQPETRRVRVASGLRLIELDRASADASWR